MDLENIKKAYFIGIGGIGTSALAQLLFSRGIEVMGSDVSATPVTDKLEERGIKVLLDQKRENITDDIDLIIYTIAIPEDNPEIQEAKEKNIELKTYPEMLGIVSADSYTIAIAGTHGKTTTTAMTADVMVDGGLRSTVIVGSLVSRYGSNFIEGGQEYFLVEACEYKRSFLNINPNILAIVNIEEDHLDYYKDLADIQSSFKTLVDKVPEDGYIICNPDDPNLEKVLSDAKAKVIDYTKMPEVELKVPGDHNVENSKVALAIGNILNVSNPKRSLQEFSGTWRRFEYKGRTKEGALVFDDYAHHPREIEVTLKALLEKFPEKRIHIVFQPHLFSRTKSLLKEFSESFNFPVQVLIAPIYAAREKDDGTISNVDLANLIKNAEAVGIFDEAVEKLGSLSSDDLIMTMGAGDIYKFGDMLMSGD